MADALAKKLAKDYMRDRAMKTGSYVFSAPDRNDRGKKLSSSDKVRWEIERYSDPRWAIPEDDLKILMTVKKRAKQLDAGHRIGPLKFGQSAILGVVPAIGDFADVILAYFRVYLKAREISEGEDLFAFKSKAKVRIILLGAIGTFPILGDLADTILMFNTRNAASLERLLLKRSGYFELKAKEKALKKAGRRAQGSHPSNISVSPPRYEDVAAQGRLPSQSCESTQAKKTAKKQNKMLGWLSKDSMTVESLGLHKSTQNSSRSGSVEVETVPSRPTRPRQNFF